MAVPDAKEKWSGAINTVTIFVLVAVAFVGCADRKPSRTTVRTEGHEASEEAAATDRDVPGTTAEAGGQEELRPKVAEGVTGCRLAWKLPAGLRLRYVCEMSAQGSGRMAMKASLTLNVDITAPEDGLALVDTSLGDVSVKVGDRDMPGGMLAQVFKVHCILDAEKGFDPHGALAREQRNVFEMFFPLPYKEVKTGEEWPLRIQMLSLGPGATGKESAVAALEEVTGERGGRTAKIALRSAASVASEPGTVARAMSMNMSVTGSAHFDLSAGRFTSNVLTASIEMPAMPFPGEPEPKGMEMKTALKVKLVECDALDAEELARASKALATRKAVGEAVKLAKEGKNAEALAILRDGPLQAGLSEEHAHLVAAQVHARMGGWQEARDAVEKELDQFPRSLQALNLAQLIYRRTGQTAKTEEIQKKLQQLMRGGSAAPGAAVPRPPR